MTIGGKALLLINWPLFMGARVATVAQALLEAVVGDLEVVSRLHFYECRAGGDGGCGAMVSRKAPRPGGEPRAAGAFLFLWSHGLSALLAAPALFLSFRSCGIRLWW